MPIIRKFAVQGHQIPGSVYSPHGPFPPEVLAQSGVEYEEYQSDSLHEALDDFRLFRCRDCGDILHEEQLTIHECEEIENE